MACGMVILEILNKCIRTALDKHHLFPAKCLVRSVLNSGKSMAYYIFYKMLQRNDVVLRVMAYRVAALGKMSSFRALPCVRSPLPHLGAVQAARRARGCHILRKWASGGCGGGDKALGEGLTQPGTPTSRPGILADQTAGSWISPQVL